MRRFHGDAVTTFVITAIVIGLALFILPNFLRARACGQLCACKSNLKNIGTALEMYAADNEKKYPPELDRITPNYLKVIPTCASAGRNTYLYKQNEDPDAYTVLCNGSYHITITNRPNYPQYDSIQGLIEP